MPDVDAAVEHLRELTRTPHIYWASLPVPEVRTVLDALAEARVILAHTADEKARAEAAEAERDKARTARDGWMSQQAKTADRMRTAEAKLARIAEQPSAEFAWRDGYFTGKRDYAASITGGTPISTPNPYILNKGTEK